TAPPAAPRRHGPPPPQGGGRRPPRAFGGGRAEAAVLVRGPVEQRRRFMPRVAAFACEPSEPIADAGKPDGVRIVHRSATPDRKAVAVDPDHVDIARVQRDPLLEDARAFVDHRVDQPLDDLLPADRAPLDTEPRARTDDQRLDLRIRPRRARSGLVEIESFAGL